MPQNRINKRIFEWSISNSSTSCKNWYFKFKAHMSSLNLDVIFDENVHLSKSYILSKIHDRSSQTGGLNLIIRNVQMEAKVNFVHTSLLKMFLKCF